MSRRVPTVHSRGPSTVSNHIADRMAAYQQSENYSDRNGSIGTQDNDGLNKVSAYSILSSLRSKDGLKTHPSSGSSSQQVGTSSSTVTTGRTHRVPGVRAKVTYMYDEEQSEKDSSVGLPRDEVAPTAIADKIAAFQRSSATASSNTTTTNSTAASNLPTSIPIGRSSIAAVPTGKVLPVVVNCPVQPQQVSDQNNRIDDLVSATYTPIVAVKTATPRVLVEAAAAGSLHTPSLTVDQARTVLVANPEVINELDANGRTPLLVACFGKKWELATYLVEQGADVTVKDKVRLLCMYVMSIRVLVDSNVGCL